MEYLIYSCSRPVYPVCLYGAWYVLYILCRTLYTIRFFFKCTGNEWLWTSGATQWVGGTTHMISLCPLLSQMLHVTSQCLGGNLMTYVLPCSGPNVEWTNEQPKTFMSNMIIWPSQHSLRTAGYNLYQVIKQISNVSDKWSTFYLCKIYFKVGRCNGIMPSYTHSHVTYFTVNTQN